MANLIRRGGGSERAELVPRWDPFRTMRDLLRWDPFAEAEFLPRGEMFFTPAWEVMERKDAYVFKADLPGIKEDDLDISLTGTRLTVSGKRETAEEESGERYYARERMYGSFTRSFTLPEGVDAEHVTADLKDGVLTLFIPKRPEVQPKRIALKPISGKSDKAKA